MAQEEASSAATPATAKVAGATYSSPEMRKYMSILPLTPIETQAGNDKLPFEMVDEEQSEHQCKLVEAPIA